MVFQLENWKKYTFEFFFLLTLWDWRHSVAWLHIQTICNLLSFGPPDIQESPFGQFGTWAILSTLMSCQVRFYTLLLWNDELQYSNPHKVSMTTLFSIIVWIKHNSKLNTHAAALRHYHQHYCLNQILLLRGIFDGFSYRTTKLCFYFKDDNESYIKLMNYYTYYYYNINRFMLWKLRLFIYTW